MPTSLKTISQSSLAEMIESRAQTIHMDLKYSILLAFRQKSIFDLSRKELVLLYKIVFSLSSYQEMRQIGRTKHFYLGVKFEDCAVGCIKNSLTSEGPLRAFFAINSHQVITLVSAQLMSRAERNHHVNQHIQNYFMPTISFLKSKQLSWEDFKGRTVKQVSTETEIKAESTLSVNEEESNPWEQISDKLEKLTYNLYREEFSGRRLAELLNCFSQLTSLKKQDANFDQLEQSLLQSAFLFSKIFDMPDVQIYFDHPAKNKLQLVYIRGNKIQRYNIAIDIQTLPEKIISELLKLTEDFLEISPSQLVLEHASEDELKQSDELNISMDTEKYLLNFSHCVYGSWPMIPEAALQLTQKYQLTFPEKNGKLLFSLLKYPDKLICHSGGVIFLLNMILGDDRLVHLLSRKSARHLLTMAVSEKSIAEEIPPELLKKCFKELKHLVSLACLEQIKRTADKNGLKLPKEVEEQLKTQNTSKLKKEFKSSFIATNVKAEQEVKVSKEESKDEEDTLKTIKLKVEKAISEKSKNKKRKAWSEIKKNLREVFDKNTSLPAALFKPYFLEGNPMSLYGLAYHHIKANTQLLNLLEEQAKLHPELRNNFFKSALDEIFSSSDWKTFERLLSCGFVLEDGNDSFATALAKVIKKSDWKTFEQLLLSGLHLEKYHYKGKDFISFVISNCICILDKRAVGDFNQIMKIFINSIELLGESDRDLQSFIDSTLFTFIVIISRMRSSDEHLFFHETAEYLIVSGADPNYSSRGNFQTYKLDISLIDLAIIAAINKSLNTSLKESLIKNSLQHFKIATLLLEHGAMPTFGINSLVLGHCLKETLLEIPQIQLFYGAEYVPYIDELVKSLKLVAQSSSSEYDEILDSPSSDDETSEAPSGHDKQLIESIPVSLRTHPILLHWKKSFKLNPLAYYSPNLFKEHIQPFDFLSLDAFIFYMATPLHLSLLFQQRELTHFLLAHSAKVNILLEPKTVEKLIERFELPWTKEELNNATLLHLAVLTGDQHAFVHLLDKGADIDAKNAEGETAENMLLKKLEQLMEQKKSQSLVEKSQQLQIDIEIYRSMLFALFAHESEDCDETINRKVNEIMENFNQERPGQSLLTARQSIFASQQPSETALPSSSSSSVSENQDSESPPRI